MSAALGDARVMGLMIKQKIEVRALYPSIEPRRTILDALYTPFCVYRERAM